MNEPSQGSYPRPGLFLVGGLLIAVGFACSYWSTLTELVSAWEDEPDYSHGYFVVPIAIWFLWLRKDRFPRTSIQPAVCWGLALVATSILIRYLGDRFYVQAVDGWSLVVWIAGVVLTLCGWRVLWWSLPAIVFLLFMIPMPYRLEIMFRQPLQDLATQISCAALVMLGQLAIAEGNTIRIGDLRFGVEEACSGLRIFMGIAALAFVYVIAVKRSWVIRVLLILAMLPVTLIANSTRIVATCLLHLYVSGEVSYKFSHDAAGFIMIPFAAALFALILWFLGFLIREERVESKSGRSREKILVQPNVPRVVATLVVLAATVPLAYGWHSYRNSRLAHVWLNLADESAAIEDWQSATNYLHKYLQTHPDDAEVQIRLAETYDKSIDDLRKTERAIKLYYEALPLVPAEKVPVIRARIAELHLDLASVQPVRYAAAEAEAKNLLEANAKDPQGHRLLALALLGRQATSGATGDLIGGQLEEAWQLNQGDVQIAIALAQGYRQNLDYMSFDQRARDAAERERMADEIVNKMVEVNSASANALFARCQYRLRNTLPGVEEDLQSALKQSPNGILLRLLAAGLAKDKANREGALPDEIAVSYEEAKQHYEHLLDVDGAPIELVYIALGELHLSRGEVAHAIDTWQQGLAAVGSDSVDLNLRLARQFLNTNQLGEAERVLTEVERGIVARISTTPKESRRTARRQLRFFRGRWHLQEGDFDKAIPLLKSVVRELERPSERFPAWRLLGIAYVAKQQSIPAAEAFRKAARIRPDNVEIKRLEANAWFEAGDSDRAVAGYQQVLAIERSPDAWLDLARAHFQSQIRLPTNKRNWVLFDEALSAADKSPSEKQLTDPWRRELLEASYTVARASEQEIEVPGSRSKSVEDALELLRAAEESHPTSEDLMQRLVVLYERLGAREDADRVTQFLRDLEEPSAEHYLLCASVYLARGDNDTAQAILREGVEKLPVESCLALDVQLIRIAEQKGTGESFYEAMTGLREKYPSNRELLTRLAGVALELQTFKDLELYENLLGELEGPEGPIWRYFRVRRLLAQAKDRNAPRVREAEKLCRQLQRDRLEWSGTHVALGYLASLRGDQTAAAEAFKEAIRLGDRSVKTYELLVALLVRNQQFAAADQYLTELASRQPITHNLASVQIQVAERLGQYDRALETASQLADRLPEDALVHTQLARTLVAKQQAANVDDTRRSDLGLHADEALEEAERLIQADPENKRNLAALLELANIRVKQHREEQAIGVYRRILELDPNHTLALNNLATMLAESPDAETRREAREYVDRAIQLLGPDPALLDTKGMIFYHDGNIVKAIECLEAATANSDPRSSFHLALAYNRARQTDRARRALARATESGLETMMLTEFDQRQLDNLRIELAR